MLVGEEIYKDVTKSLEVLLSDQSEDGKMQLRGDLVNGPFRDVKKLSIVSPPQSSPCCSKHHSL
jgi:hypothetical protein